MTWAPLLTESELKAKQKEFVQRFRHLLDNDAKFGKSFRRLVKRDENLEDLWVSISNAVVYKEK